MSGGEWASRRGGLEAVRRRGRNSRVGEEPSEDGGCIYMIVTVAQSLDQIELCVHPGELALRLVRSESNRVARNV